jgi:hypothetical protein
MDKKTINRNPHNLALVCGDQYVHCGKTQTVIGYDSRTWTRLANKNGLQIGRNIAR